MNKIKVYLDTNTVLDFFINQAKHFKGKGEPKIPEKMKFMLDNFEKFQFIVSFLTKAEIMRELVAGHSIEPARVENFWSDFMKSLNEPKYVEKFIFDEKLVELAGKSKIRLRTLVNFQHLFIAIAKTHILYQATRILQQKQWNLGFMTKY